MSRQPNGGFIGKENITDSTTASGMYTLSDAAQKVANNEYPTARYTASRSLRFSAARSTYLNRTPSVAGNRKTWTWSGWVKRGLVDGNYRCLFEAGTSNPWFGLLFSNSGVDNKIQISFSSGTSPGTATTAEYRDPSAWYHIVVAVDTTQAISSNRVKLYVNGVQITSFSTTNYPSQNFDTQVNSTVRHTIGNNSADLSSYFDGYMSEVNFIDGQALTPSAFGESDVRTGEWKPKRYAGTYGTNGFYLSFANNSTTSTLGLDDGTGLPGSGAGSNDWTSVNHSVSIGVNYDSMTDVPGVGSQVTNDTGNVTRGNYCTWNNASPTFQDTSFSNGNLNVRSATNGLKTAIGTMSVGVGKWYFEQIITENSDPYRAWIGFIEPSMRMDANGGFYLNDAPGFSATWNLGNTTVSYGTQSVFKSSPGSAFEITTATVSDTKALNDVYMFAYDGTTGKVWFGKNGTWFNSGNPNTGANPAGTLSLNYQYSPAVNLNVTGSGNAVTLNAGQRPFTYTPPAGFKSLCTTNLPEPTIKRPQDHFDIKLWTGNGGSQTIGNTSRKTDNYEISRSLRFNSADSSQLTRTPATAGNRKTWTWSGWVKRGALGSNRMIFNCDNGTTDATFGSISFLSSDSLNFGAYNVAWRVSTQVFRDPAAWYHIVVAFDTTQATAANRVKMYVNGVQITAFSTSNDPTLNTDYAINQAAIHNIGKNYSGFNYFDGYLAEVNLIDGQALTPESFGVFDVDGSWQAKRYIGTYGTNGFHLNFSDNSNTTATTLGKDQAGSNNWTPNNFSVAAGINNDSLVDVPTNWGGDDVDSGGEVRGNYAILNNSDKGSVVTVSNGGLGWAQSTTTAQAIRATLPMPTGKWYWELNAASNNSPGILKQSGSISAFVGADSKGWSYFVDGTLYNNNSSVAFGATHTGSDIISVAFDADAGKLWFAKNGTWQASGNPSTGANAINVPLDPNDLYYPAMSTSVTGAVVGTVNFGQRAFTYTPPTGFKSLNTKNMDEQYPFVSGPDLVWIKRRNAASSHTITDTVRGANREIWSNLTTAEQSGTGQFITQFNSNGFVLGASQSGTGDANISGGTYVGWCWNAGSRTVGNSDGTINSTIRASKESGFSIVSYNGTLSGTPNPLPSVGHGLGTAPKFIIGKSLSAVGVESGNYFVWHSDAGVGNWLRLNLTNAVADISSNGGGTMVAPNNSVFYTPYISGSNISGNRYIAYCWSEIPGYSKFGKYTGNGSADGPFVYCGFKPRWVLIRSTSGARDWLLYDTSRLSYNTGPEGPLQSNTSGTPYNNTGYVDGVDILSNGFKLRAATTNLNASGETMIYTAFAEHPFRYSTSR
jgi:hypothetical protein